MLLICLMVRMIKSTSAKQLLDIGAWLGDAGSYLQINVLFEGCNDLVREGWTESDIDGLKAERAQKALDALGLVARMCERVAGPVDV